jgi:hypothetical protein
LHALATSPKAKKIKVTIIRIEIIEKAELGNESFILKGQSSGARRVFDFFCQRDCRATAARPV